jgi:hypothetical protein
LQLIQKWKQQKTNSGTQKEQNDSKKSTQQKEIRCVAVGSKKNFNNVEQFFSLTKNKKRANFAKI